MAATVGSKTEVTKLITVTLGKLQESKHAKCGLNLRKSLLVASVLHKARDIYVTEVKNRRLSARVMDSTTTDSENNGNENGNNNNQKPQTAATPAKIRRFASKRSMSVIEEEESNLSSQNEDTHNHLLSSSSSSEANRTTSTASVTESDAEDSSLTAVRPRKRLCTDDSTSEEESRLAVDDILEELASENDSSVTTDKENNPPTNEPLLTSTAVSCGRCLKRRASTDYPEVCDQDNNNQGNSKDSYSSNQFSYAMKKRSRSNSLVVCDSSSLEESKSCAMDSTQINSLVNIFSQSFSEFTSTDSDNIYETSTEMNTFALCRDSIALTA